MAETLEWWPDYRGGPLWKASGRGGQQVDARALDLPLDLAARLAAWSQRYAEDKLPVTGEGDPEWLEQGVQLLAEVRRCLAGRFEVVVSEPWWGKSHTADSRLVYADGCLAMDHNSVELRDDSQ